MSQSAEIQITLPWTISAYKFFGKKHFFSNKNPFFPENYHFLAHPCVSIANFFQRIVPYRVKFLKIDYGAPNGQKYNVIPWQLRTLVITIIVTNRNKTKKTF